MNGWTGAAFDRWLTTEPEWRCGDDNDDGPDCLGPEGTCSSEHVPPCPLAGVDF